MTTEQAENKAKPYLSHTQMDMYGRCGECYRRRYVEGEKVPPVIAMMTGSAVHTGAEMNFGQKIESHADMPETDIVEVSVESFKVQTSGGYSLSEDEISRGSSIVLAAATDMVAKLASLHAREQAPDYQPVAVEHTTRIVLPNSTHDLLCITDLRDDRNRVTDFKNVKRSPKQDAADSSVQLTIEAAAQLSDTGTLPAEVRLDNLVKTKTPKRVVLSSTRTPRDVQVLVNRMNSILKAINAGVFTPCAVGSWNCSPMWCGYWATCPYVNSDRRSAAEGE